MKKILLMLLGVLIALPTFARDFDYEYEGQTLTYTVLDEDAKTVETKKGYMFYSGNSVTGALVIPSVAKDENNVEYSVTSIGESAFLSCSGLTSVTIPNSVTSIGSHAFHNCYGLKEVIIGSAVETIGEMAFFCCDGLIKSAYPNTLSNPFSNGRAISYPKGAIIEDGFVFGPRKLRIYYAPLSLEGEYVVPGFYIEEWAFYKCTGLTAVIIPNSVTSIGDYAFGECSGLKELTFNAENCTSCGSSSSPAFPSSIETLTIGESVKTIPSFAFKGCSGLKEVTFNAENCTSCGTYSDPAFPSTIETLTIGESVKSIPSYAFKGCSGLKEVKSLNEVAPSINANSFKGLYETAEAIVPDNSLMNYLDSNWSLFSNLRTESGIAATTFTDDVFKYRVNGENSVMLIAGNYSNMTSVSIPERVVYNDKFHYVTYIGDNAFKDCEKIKKLVLPKRLAGIGVSAFQGCSALTEVTIPNSITSIGSHAFYDCSGLTKAEFASIESLCSIKFGNGSANPLYYAPNLYIDGNAVTEVVIPGTVTQIGQYAFVDCYRLTELTIGSAVETIGRSAFSGCYRLTSVTIPKSVTSIGENAFFKCSGLTSINIPENVTSIGSQAFYGCSGLKKATIEDGTSQISLGKYVFSSSFNLYIGRDWESESQVASKEVTTLTLGNTVTTIPANSFAGCSNLASVTFGSSVETIGENAFSNCKLTELVLSPATKTVGANAFMGNDIKNIAMGANVTEIGAKAFDGSNDLNGVSITAVNPPSAENTTFSYYGCPLYVVPSENDVVKDAYYNFTRCWYRFSSYDLIPIQEVKITGNSSVELKPGESVKLTATFTPADASLPYIFWRSTNPKIATVDKDGVVKRTVPNNDIETYADESESCQIIAETLYSNGPVAMVTIVGDESGVEDVIMDNPAVAPAANNDIYNIQGVCIKRDATDDDIRSLSPGFYIVRGKKVMVK